MKIAHKIILSFLLALFLLPLPCLAQTDSGPHGSATFIYGDREAVVPNLKKAWGFITLIEYDGKKILFNGAGVESIFENNLKVLGIDPKDLDAMVISHEHWEMIEGLDYIFERNPLIDIYAPQTVIKLLTTRHPDWKPRFKNINGYMEFSPNVAFYNQRSGNRRGGPVGIDEISILLKSDQGLIIFIGCGHPELLQNIFKSKQAIGINKINLLAGGTHLIKSGTQVAIEYSGENFIVPQGIRYTEEGYRTLMQDFKDAGVQYIMPTHCTMEPVEGIFREVFGDKYINHKLGMRLELPIKEEEKDEGEGKKDKIGEGEDKNKQE